MQVLTLINKAKKRLFFFFFRRNNQIFPFLVKEKRRSERSAFQNVILVFRDRSPTP